MLDDDWRAFYRDLYRGRIALGTPAAPRREPHRRQFGRLGERVDRWRHRLGWRPCFLVIEGQGWAITEDVPVEQEGAARAFAAQVNAAAGTADAPAAAPTVDVAGQIEKLADLRAKGILTEDEFAGKKAELLARL